MIYPKLKSKMPINVSVKNLGGGVNMRERSVNIDDGQCVKMSNLWYKDGVLKNRPGINVSPENKLYDADSFHSLWYDVSVFPSETAPLSEPCRLCLCRESTMEGVFLKFYLLYRDGSIKEAGNIDFYRVSPYATLSTPHLCSVFCADRTLGSGIYIMLSMYNYEEEDPNSHIRFYELNGTLDGWENVTDTVMYVPTVYINGRGNNYGAVWEEPVPSFAPTAFCEPMNMLTGKFKAIYGTDGLSHTFKLPFENLTERRGEDIVCTMAIDTARFTWVIPWNSTQSAPVSTLGKNVIATVDRQQGKIIFVYENYDYAPLSIASTIGNNLEITAYKTDIDPINVFNSAQVCCEYSGRLFIGGFERDENAVYFSAMSNPFYFPSQNIVRTSFQTGRITALAKQNKLLIAFKENECYSISSKNVTEYDMKRVIEGTEKFPSKLSDIRLDILSSEIGCDCPATLLNCANRLVWLSSTGTIYTIIASNQFSKGNVYELSLNIEPFLNGLDADAMRSAFAVCNDGYYIAFIGKRAVAMDYTIKGFRYVASCSDQKSAGRTIHWYLWELPKEITFLDGVTINGKALLVGCRATDEDFWYGTATLWGDEDCIPCGNFENLYVERRSIPFSLRTKSFDFGSGAVKKITNGAYLCMDNFSNAQLSALEGERVLASKKLSRQCINGDSNFVSFRNVSFNHLALDIEGESPVSIGGFEIRAV